MESYSELKERLNRVIAQKDRYGKAICELQDAIRHGLYNGLFESGFRDREKDKSECPEGKKYSDVSWGGCRDVLVCQRARCPMTFEMRKLWEAYEKSMELGEEQDAARIPFSLDEIPNYEPNIWDYCVSKEWFAKRMVRFILSYRMGTGDKDFGEAFSRLIGFGMESIGMKVAWRQLLDMGEMGVELKNRGKSSTEIMAEIRDRTSGWKELKKLINRVYRVGGRRGKLATDIKKSPARALSMLVLYAVLFWMEYDFKKTYPGADNGIYRDVLNFLGRCCLIACKVNPDDRFEILEFINSDDKMDSIWQMKVAT